MILPESIPNFLSFQELNDRFNALTPSPKDVGTVDLICIRPTENSREVKDSVIVDNQLGIIGDNWKSRGSKHTPDGSAIPDAQITIMNSRIINLITQDKNFWSLAGDQLFIDLDISSDNLPSGSRLTIDDVILEVTPLPHNGCIKFSNRFGSDATKFVSNKEGQKYHRRGIYVKVIKSGRIHTGSIVKKL
ncbi:MAG: MOSC domain-containing protein [Candidatus Thorarchaeota archaeon]